MAVAPPCLRTLGTVISWDTGGDVHRRIMTKHRDRYTTGLLVEGRS